jgi:transcriptional regulator GlxA family with amidase domain
MKYMTTIKILVIIIALFSVLVFRACGPIKEFGRTPVYNEANHFIYPLPGYDSLKKTVVIVANNGGTELFDMMAPYYLFNATEKANVYIVAKNKFPITAKKGVFLLPQSTFSEIDSLGIKPDVIVIPFLAVADSVNQDPVILSWIKRHYTAEVNVLSICDGAATAAATGIYDGKPITAHASDFAGIKSHFSKPRWVQNIGVANYENLYSTAGVSNAAEGSLVVIDKLFGLAVMKKVMDDVGYPYQFPRTEHQSNTLDFASKVSIAKKIIFRQGKKIGVLLQDGINEFALAGIMDAYNRTFPRSIESFTFNNLPVKTKYGLTLIPTGKPNDAGVDELHIVNSSSISISGQSSFKSAELIKYDVLPKQYIIDKCLQRIHVEYGREFENVVKLTLDYN